MSGWVQADGEVREFGRGAFGGEGVVEDELAGDGGALGERGVVDAVDPVEGPLGILLSGLGERVLPEGVGVGGPAGAGRWGCRRWRRGCRAHGWVVGLGESSELT